MSLVTQIVGYKSYGCKNEGEKYAKKNFCPIEGISGATKKETVSRRKLSFLEEEKLFLP